MGPVSNEPQYRKVLSHFESAKEQGATIAYGGRASEELGGYFVEPTVLTDVTSDMRAVVEEIFGPVLSVLTFRTPAEAIEDCIDGIERQEARVAAKRAARAAAQAEAA